MITGLLRGWSMRFSKRRWRGLHADHRGYSRERRAAPERKIAEGRPTRVLI